MAAHVYDLGEWYGQGNALSTAPHWLVAVYHLGRPVTYSRRRKRGIGRPTEGAISRKEKPFILDGVQQLEVTNDKRSHTKGLAAVLKPHENLMDRDLICPGDWMMAWMHDNRADHDRVRAAVEAGQQQANGFRDGLKFVGRVEEIRKVLTRDPQGGVLTRTFHLSGTGFAELATNFWYDVNLASSAAQGDLQKFMPQIGLDYGDLIDKNLANAGQIKDNADLLIVSLVNIILGAGASGIINTPAERAAEGTAAGDAGRLRASPQHTREAPAAYLVPRAVGLALGRKEPEASKDERVFGYADVLDVLVGTQTYDGSGFYPELDLIRSRRGRKFCAQRLKGTFLPTNLTFVNQPLWGLLQQYLNPQLNEMYTALKLDETGDAVMPTLVARQHPFSTSAAVDRVEFPLTPFLSLPRWRIPDYLARHADLGQSDALRANLAHVYGQDPAFYRNKSISEQIARNPPIFDDVDISRSGIRARMGIVQCALSDIEAMTTTGPTDANGDPAGTSAASFWMEAIADWSFDGHLKVTGSLELSGVQAPISEGDNVEFDGLALHVESVTHRCWVDGEGKKRFRTSLRVSEGMPVDQTGATDDYPVFSGLKNQAVTGTNPVPDAERARMNAIIGGDLEDVPPSTASDGDAAALTSMDPGLGGA